MKWPTIFTPAVDFAISLALLVLNGTNALATGDPFPAFVAGVTFVLACCDWRTWQESRQKGRS